MLREVTNRARHGRDIATQQIQHGWLCAAIGGVLHINTSAFAQQCADKVRR